MKKARSKLLCQAHPMKTGLFMLITLLTLLLVVPNMEAAAGDAPGCPHASKKSSAGCPYKAGPEGTGCPCMQASQGCLHALTGDLQLDEGQVKRIKEIRGRFEEDSSELRAAIRKKKEELDRLFRDPNAGTDDFIAGRKALFALKQQMAEMETDSRLKIRGELNAEQIRALPEGCWRGLLPRGCGCKCKGQEGTNTCPYRKAPSGDSPA